jgi:hypothetical protein
MSTSRETMKWQEWLLHRLAVEIVLDYSKPGFPVLDASVAAAAILMLRFHKAAKGS